MTDQEALLAAILSGHLDGCGVLADYLEERGDPRGVLLLRRWKRWQKERAAAQERQRQVRAALEQPLFQLRAFAEAARAVGAVCHVTGEVSYRDNGADLADESLLRYVRERFATEAAA